MADSDYEMNPEREKHLQSIVDSFTNDVKTKYELGQKEHGFNLWEKPGMLDFAIQEVQDLAVYLYTLKQQLNEKEKS